MAERAAFPGEPERYRTVNLLELSSKDGLAIDFNTTIDLQSLASPTNIHLDIEGSGVVSIPMKVLEDVGDGDTRRGLELLAAEVSCLDYQEVVPGDKDPLYAEFIHPFYGGLNGFLIAMDSRDLNLTPRTFSAFLELKSWPTRDTSEVISAQNLLNAAEKYHARLGDEAMIQSIGKSSTASEVEFAELRQHAQILNGLRRAVQEGDEITVYGLAALDKLIKGDPTIAREPRTEAAHRTILKVWQEQR